MNPADANAEGANRVKGAFRKRSCHVPGRDLSFPRTHLFRTGDRREPGILEKKGIWFDHFPCMFTRIMHGIKGKRRIQIYRAFFESSTGVYSGR